MPPRVISMKDLEAMSASWKLKIHDGKTAFDVAIETKDEAIFSVLQKIANDAQAELFYLSCMRELLELGANPENILVSLEYSELQHGIDPIGLRIAEGHNRRVEYFKLLTDCLNKGASAARIIKHLQMLPLLNVIKPNDYHDIKKSYLSLIHALLKKDANINTIVKLFNIEALGKLDFDSTEITFYITILMELFTKGASGTIISLYLHGYKDAQRSAGYKIATCKNGNIHPDNLRDAAQQYLTLITALVLRSEINPKEILDFLLIEARRRNVSKARISYLIAESHSIHIDAFFNLLEALLSKNVKPEEILSILLHKEKNVYPFPSTLGHVVIRNHIVGGYFNLLRSLLIAGLERKQIIELISNDIRYIKYNNKHSSRIITHMELGRYLLPLLQSGLFHERDYLSFTTKDEIFNCILALPAKEKHDALRNSLDPTHPLCKFFSLETGLYITNLLTGSLRKVLDEFVLIATPDDAEFLLTVLENIFTNERSKILLSANENQIYSIISHIASTKDPLVANKIMEFAKEWKNKNIGKFRYRFNTIEKQMRDIVDAGSLEHGLPKPSTRPNAEPSAPMAEPTAEDQLTESNRNLINVLYRISLMDNPPVTLMHFVELCLQNKSMEEFTENLEDILQRIRSKTVSVKNHELPEPSAPLEEPLTADIVTKAATTYKSELMLALSSTSSIQTPAAETGMTEVTSSGLVAQTPPETPSITDVSIFSTTTTKTQTQEPTSIIAESPIPTEAELESRIKKLKTKPANDISSSEKRKPVLDNNRKAVFG